MSTPSRRTVPAAARCKPGDRAQQRRLPGAVRADDRVDLAGATLRLTSASARSWPWWTRQARGPRERAAASRPLIGRPGRRGRSRARRGERLRPSPPCPGTPPARRAGEHVAGSPSPTMPAAGEADEPVHDRRRGHGRRARSRSRPCRPREPPRTIATSWATSGSVRPPATSSSSSRRGRVASARASSRRLR